MDGEQYFKAKIATLTNDSQVHWNLDGDSVENSADEETGASSDQVDSLKKVFDKAEYSVAVAKSSTARSQLRYRSTAGADCIILLRDG